MVDDVMDLLTWLERSSVAAAIRESLWLYPLLEIVHISGFVMLVGAAAIFDLRLLGVARRTPVDQVARLVLPVSQLSVLVVVPSGLALFASDAVSMSANPAFRLKLVLIACAALNAYVFHRWRFPGAETWRVNGRAPARARLAAVSSLLLWAGVISCGRLIAYL